jgi:signal transduction histidine kinase
VLEGLRSGIDESLDARVAITLKSAADIPTVLLAPDLVHHLLLTALFAGLEADRAGGRVRVHCRAREGRVEFVVEDAGPPFEPDPSGALRGRTLTLAASRSILAAMGGRLRVAREHGRTEVVFDLPAESA